MIARLTTWFASRTRREQILLASMAVLAVLTLAWALVIRPLGDALSSATARHTDAVLRLASTRARVEVVDTARRAPLPRPGAPLETTIRDRANDAGFALASVDTEGSRVQVTIASAKPGPLVAWLAELERSGILVDNLSTTDHGDRTVAVRMSLKARS